MGAVLQSLSIPIYLLAVHSFLQKERRSLTQRRLQVTFVPGLAPVDVGMDILVFKCLNEHIV